MLAPDVVIRPSEAFWSESGSKAIVGPPLLSRRVITTSISAHNPLPFTDSERITPQQLFRFVAFGSNRGVPGEPPAPKTGTPAPGYRHALYGTLYYVGNNGFSWASSVAGTYTYRLYFDCSAVHPNDYGYHAYGFPLRCLQE